MIYSKYNLLKLSIYEDQAKLYHKYNGELTEIHFNKPEQYKNTQDLIYEVQPLKKFIKGKLKRDDKEITVLTDVLRLSMFDENGNIELINASLDNFIIK